MDPSDPMVIATIVCDIIITVSYFAIPIEIWFFQRSLTKPLPFKFVLVFFELFITACGITHLVGVWSPWSRTDPALLATKAFCALVSLLTASVLVVVIPKLFSLPVKTALLQEELGFRIRHEQSLQVANDLLIKFRKITHRIRKTLDINTICETSVYELGQSLDFGGFAIFMPEENNGRYICSSEYIKNYQKMEETSGIKTHYWKTITIDPKSDVVSRMLGVTCAFHLSNTDLIELVNKQRGILYRSGIAISFYLAENGPKGFILAFNEFDVASTTEQDAELFEDVVSQIEIALQQARQIQNEYLHLNALQNQIKNNANLDRAKHSAEVSNSLKTKFLSSMSRDIQSPIHDLANLVQLLYTKVPTKEQKDILDLMKGTSLSLKVILSDLSDFLKIEQGDLQLNIGLFTIESCLKRFIEYQELFASSKEINLSYEISKEVPTSLISDSNRIRQLLSNFTNNSIRYSKESSQVSVFVGLTNQPPPTTWLNEPKTCSFSHDFNSPTDLRDPFQQRNSNPLLSHTKANLIEVYFHVVDSGMGMRYDQCSRMFRTIDHIDNPIPDFKSQMVQESRFDDPTHHGGLGLGLAISTHLVKQFNGKLSVHTCFGKGSIFTFSVQCSIPSANES